MEFFDKLDLDNSGFLDRNEIHELLIKLQQPPTEEELDAIMGQVDADGNGEVELSEFMTWWKRVGAAKRQELTALNDKLNEARRRVWSHRRFRGSGTESVQPKLARVSPVPLLGADGLTSALQALSGLPILGTTRQCARPFDR